MSGESNGSAPEYQPWNAVLLTGIKCDVGVVAKAFGFATASGLIENTVDDDAAVGWSPHVTTFTSNGGAAAFEDIITTSHSPYAAIEFDMGEECTLGYFTFVVEGATTLPACVLYGSHNPATSTSNTLQIGDVKLGTYSTADMNDGNLKTSPVVTSGAKYRYYRFVVNKDVNVGAPDGTAFLEWVPKVTTQSQWLNSDYDSIWGKGDRIENGLINMAVEAGVGSITAHFTETFSFTGGGGYFGTPTLGGYAAFQIERGIFITGIQWRGSSHLEMEPFWHVLGGIAPGTGVVMHASFQGFNVSTSLVGSGYRQEIPFNGPGMDFPWPWYTIQTIILPTSPGALGRFCEKMYLKVAHSSLDGGNRLNTGGTTPGKEVTVTTNYTIAAGDLSVLVDGVSTAGDTGSPQTPADAFRVRLIRETTANKWLAFEFPRRVSMHEMVLNTGSAEVYDISDDPTVYGYWQWQGSDNGIDWTNVGPVWKFKNGCSFMLAPDPQPGIPGQLFFNWRMNHVSGMAWMSEPLLFEAIFNLTDPNEMLVAPKISFTDDDDATTGLVATVTLSDPVSPFEGATFSDGASDSLNVIVTLKQNPVLKIAFTDDSEFNAYSDIFPSTVVQTMLHVTGR